MHLYAFLDFRTFISGLDLSSDLWIFLVVVCDLWIVQSRSFIGIRTRQSSVIYNRDWFYWWICIDSCRVVDLVISLRFNLFRTIFRRDQHIQTNFFAHWSLLIDSNSCLTQHHHHRICSLLTTFQINAPTKKSFSFYAVIGLLFCRLWFRLLC